LKTKKGYLRSRVATLGEKARSLDIIRRGEKKK